MFALTIEQFRSTPRESRLARFQASISTGARPRPFACLPGAQRGGPPHESDGYRSHGVSCRVGGRSGARNCCCRFPLPVFFDHSAALLPFAGAASAEIARFAFGPPINSREIASLSFAHCLEPDTACSNCATAPRGHRPTSDAA